MNEARLHTLDLAGHLRGERGADGLMYLGGSTADRHGAVRQAGSGSLVDLPVTRHGADAQTSQDSLQTRHNLIATLRLKQAKQGDRTSQQLGVYFMIIYEEKMFNVMFVKSQDTLSKTELLKNISSALLSALSVSE